MMLAPFLHAASTAQDDAPVWLVPAVIAAFLFLFPLFWMAVIRLMALFGWGQLAGLYRYDGSFPDGMQAFRAASFSIGRGALMANYSGVAVIVIRPEGLYIRLWRLFAFGHPPVKLPWTAIESITARKMLVWTSHKLAFKGTSITLLLRGNIGETVEAAWQRHRT